MTVRFARISCCVPFCQRGSTRFPDGEYMCGKHYALADASLKNQRNAMLRKLRKRGEIVDREYRTRRAALVDSVFWRRIKAQAISRSAF